MPNSLVWAIAAGAVAGPLIVCWFLRETAQQRLQQREAANAAATAASAPAEEQESQDQRRSALIRECLEFRTISSAPKPQGLSATHKTCGCKELEQRGGGEEGSSSNDNDNGNINTTKRTSSVVETVDGDLEAEDISDSGKDDQNKEDGGNNTNATSGHSVRTRLAANILRNNSITSSVRLMIADIIRRRSSNLRNTNNVDDYDEENPALFPHTASAHHVSIEEVLPSQRVHSGPNLQHKDSCSICLETFRPGDRVAQMKQQWDNGRPCSKHWFKEDCIVEWLQTHDDCPLSRIRMIPEAVEPPPAPAVARQRAGPAPATTWQHVGRNPNRIYE